ncbi:DUF4157 domain-containing protein [Brevibacillus sp. SYSU BS000544]|uniref:eCIS core domain-containing protein n=1 Tax=Brevibacillus sp. SYSU BS000544 TaxID=3416443 RepID=UPI003CE552EF
MRHQTITTKAAEASQYKNVENFIKPMLSARSPANPILSLQKTIGNQAVKHLIQAKLKINRPGDMFEQEADRVADMVMRMPEPLLPDRQEVSGQARTSIQRKCTASCQEVEQLLQAKEELGNTPEVTPQAESSINTIKGGGQPLPASVRQFFEPRLEHDFSHVRIHADGRAAQTAHAVNALAFTTGRDIVFGTGQYSPGTIEGKRLLAHELTHVIQQSRGGLDRVQRVELIQRATREDLLSALRKSIDDGNWQEVATRLNGFNEGDIKRLARGLLVDEAANTRAAVQQHLAGWPSQQLILDSLDAGRAEVARIGAVYFEYTMAIKNADWNVAAQQLNAMSDNDITSRLEKLNNDQIMAVQNAAATQSPRVQQACDKEIASRKRTEELKKSISRRTREDPNDLLLEYFGPVPPNYENFRKLEDLLLFAGIIQKEKLYESTDVMDNVLEPHGVYGRFVTIARYGPEEHINQLQEEGMQAYIESEKQGLAVGGPVIGQASEGLVKPRAGAAYGKARTEPAFEPSSPSQAEYDARAQVLLKTIREEQRRLTTIDVGPAIDNSGKTVTMISATVEIKIENLKPGEVYVPYIDYGGKGHHAEIQKIRYATDNGYKVVYVNPSIPLCPSCAYQARQIGLTLPGAMVSQGRRSGGKSAIPLDTLSNKELLKMMADQMKPNPKYKTHYKKDW